MKIATGASDQTLATSFQPLGKLRHMKKRNILLILSFLLGIISCRSIENKQKNKIVQISYSCYGGRAQTISMLEITEDSIFYKTGRVESPSLYKEKTSKQLWKELSKLNLKEFDKIESKESVTEVDGTDVRISITTKTKVHSFLNGSIANSTEVKHFLTLLHQTITNMTPKTVM